MNINDYYKDCFAKGIKELRIKRQIKQSQLAKDLEISRETISAIELGRRLPSFELLIALADYFDISLDTLIGRTKFTKKKLSLINPTTEDVFEFLDTLETSRKYDELLSLRFDEELKRLNESENENNQTDK